MVAKGFTPKGKSAAVGKLEPVELSSSSGWLLVSCVADREVEERKKGLGITENPAIQSLIPNPNPSSLRRQPDSAVPRQLTLSFRIIRARRSSTVRTLKPSFRGDEAVGLAGDDQFKDSR